MIKLFLKHELLDEENIEALPRLEKECVELAFKEMRDGGYEEDGLFDEMKLFFQPLTVTDSELIVDEDRSRRSNSTEPTGKERD